MRSGQQAHHAGGGGDVEVGEMQAVRLNANSPLSIDLWGKSTRGRRHYFLGPRGGSQTKPSVSSRWILSALSLLPLLRCLPTHVPSCGSAL